MHPTSMRRAGLIAGLVLAGSTALAFRRPVPTWELQLTEWLNAAPGAVNTALYPVMQLGVAAAPLVVAGAVLAGRRDRRSAAAVALGGLGAWFAAKAVKHVVGRDRPFVFLSGLDVREGDGSGLGFPSGHAAVAASLAVTAALVVPRRARPLLVVTAGSVGIARIVFGVHLPLDVAGGWSLGVLSGLAAVVISERARPIRHGRAMPPS